VPEAVVEIVNKKGLHARAAAKFVKIVATYNARVQVIKLAGNGEEDSPAVHGGSILGLMMLGADAGSRLHVVAEGKQADAVITALKTLVSKRFGEGE
jgi:phosphocarrier protein HPr